MPTTTKPTPWAKSTSADPSRAATATATATSTRADKVTDARPVSPAPTTKRNVRGRPTALTRLRVHTQPRSDGGTFRPRETPPDWQQPYLDELVANGGQVVAACKVASVSRAAMYERRQANVEFAAAEREAMKLAIDTTESEARRRAVDGVQSIERRTWTDKDGCEHLIERIETKFSDTILLRLLERQETGSWRQKQQIEHSGGLSFRTRSERKAALETARAALQQQPVTAVNGRS